MYLRKISLSFPNKAVRFFSRGVYWGRHFPLKLNPAKLKSQEGEAFPLPQVDDSTLFLVDLNLQLCQLLPKSFIHRLHQPGMAQMGVDQYHQVSRPGESHPEALAE